MPVSLLQLVSIGPYDLNGFDVVVLLVLIISLLYAASRGLIREVVSLAALLVAATITLFVWGQFRFAAQDFISPAWLADWALVLGVGALSYLLMVVLLSGIGKSIAGKEVGFLDRIFGAAFGVARGLVICALAVMVMTSGTRASEEAKDYRESLEAQGIYDDVINQMPKSMRDQMEAEPKELPDLLAGSEFYPLLDRIGDGIRALPFTKMKSYADRIKEGDIEGLIDDVDGQNSETTE